MALQNQTKSDEVTVLQSQLMSQRSKFKDESAALKAQQAASTKLLEQHIVTLTQERDSIKHELDTINQQAAQLKQALDAANQQSQQQTQHLNQQIASLKAELDKLKVDQAHNQINALAARIDTLSGREVLQIAGALQIDINAVDTTKLDSASILAHDSFDAFFEDIDADAMLHDPLLRLYSVIKKAHEIGQLPVEHPIAPWIVKQGTQPDIAARFDELKYTEDMMVHLDAKTVANRNGFKIGVIKTLQADFIASQMSTLRLVQTEKQQPTEKKNVNASSSSGGVILITSPKSTA